MTICPHPQGSPEWFAARRGIPTASEAGRIITPAKGELASGRKAYAAELVAESAGAYRPDINNEDIERGNWMEKGARDFLRACGYRVKEVGFCLSDCGRYGASPDGLIDGAIPIEIKCPRPAKVIGWRQDGGLPLEHKAQVHAEMFVTGADRAVFVGYIHSEYLENYLVEVKRDDFTERLGEAIHTFCDELDALRRSEFGDEYEILFPNIEVRDGGTPFSPPSCSPS